jgi:hypothetical protein
MTAAKAAKLNDLRRQVLALDEEGLWALVCSLFPEAAEETLEDVYDALLSASRREGARISADHAFAEEDRRRGMPR